MNRANEEIPIIVETMIASIANCNPLLSAIFSSYSTYSNNIAHRAIQKVLEEFSKRISKIENIINKDYLQSNEFNSLSYRTFIKAATEVRNEKLEIFAIFLTQSVLLKDVEISDKFMFLETLDKIDIEHIYFLQRLSGRNTFKDFEHDKGWQGEKEELIELNIVRERFFLLCDYLTNIGLVSRIEKFRIEEGCLYMNREYFVSIYGMELLRFIENSKELY